jgi:hypothetical protein
VLAVFAVAIKCKSFDASSAERDSEESAAYLCSLTARQKHFSLQIGSKRRVWKFTNPFLSLCGERDENPPSARNTQAAPPPLGLLGHKRSFLFTFSFSL